MMFRFKLEKMRAEFRPLTLYQRFERAVVYLLTALIAAVVVVAVWHLMLKIVFGLVLSKTVDFSSFEPFQTTFGMIFTVIIALEFKKSLLVIAERHDTILQMRSVVLIALLAVCRKLIILDLGEADAMHMFALSAALLALGFVYRLVPSKAETVAQTDA